jgi:hypothetical protein
VSFDPQSRRLSELLEDIRSGQLQLPEFQRSYVWKWSQRFHLLSSVQKGFPVGTLLFLEVGNGSAGASFQARPLEGAGNPGTGVSPSELILDGQQRLTTLLQAFSHDVGKWVCVDLKKLYEKVGDDSDVDIDIEDFLKPLSKNKSPEFMLHNRHFLPLFFSIGTFQKKDLRERLADYAETLAGVDNDGYRHFIQKVLHKYLDPFRDYSLPVVRLRKNLDLSAVALIFTELNNTGQKLTAFDLCVARFFPNGVHLRDYLERAHQDEKFANMDSDGTITLQTIALIKDRELNVKNPKDRVSSKKAQLVKSLQPDWVRDNWDDAVSRIKTLSQAMTKVGFASSTTLPYDAVIPALSVALGDPSLSTVPENKILSKLRTFLLATAFTARYTEGTDSKRESDVNDFLQFACLDLRPDFLEDSVSTLNLLRAKPNGAKFSGFLALLNGEPLMDFRENQAVGDSIEHKHQGEIHHIFPKAYLNSTLPNHESKEKPWDSLLNMTFILPDTNKFISDKAPADYLKQIASYLVATNGVTTEKDAWTRIRSTLKSHLIEEDAFEALMSNDFQAFKVARARALSEKLRSLGVQSNFDDQDEESSEASE